MSVRDHPLRAAGQGDHPEPAGLEASQGVISSAYLKDPTDPQWKDDTAMKAWNAFLDKYYTSNFSMKFVEGFTTAGSPQQCIEELKGYFAAGIEHITLRMTSWDQHKHMKRFLDEVVPALK